MRTTRVPRDGPVPRRPPRDGRMAGRAGRLSPDPIVRRALTMPSGDPGRAFAAWRERQSRGSAFWRLPPPERERFRAAFNEQFESAIRSTDTRLLDDAWRIGFADGWRYGAAVQSGEAYRRGYAEGFDAGVGRRRRSPAPYAYERAYNQAYALVRRVVAHGASGDRERPPHR